MLALSSSMMVSPYVHIFTYHYGSSMMVSPYVHMLYAFSRFPTVLSSRGLPQNAGSCGAFSSSLWDDLPVPTRKIMKKRRSDNNNRHVFVLILLWFLFFQPLFMEEKIDMNNNWFVVHRLPL